MRAATSFVRFPVPGLRWSRGLAGRRLLEDYLRPRIPEHRASDGDDLFTALCHAQSEDGETFTDDDVVNHMIFLLMAAHDTSTSTLTTMAYYLAQATRNGRTAAATSRWRSAPARSATATSTSWCRSTW